MSQECNIVGSKIKSFFSSYKYIVVSPETKEKLRMAKLGKTQPLSTCPHCGKVGGASNMKRWHFENCKNKGEVLND